MPQHIGLSSLLFDLPHHHKKTQKDTIHGHEVDPAASGTGTGSFQDKNTNEEGVQIVQSDT